MDDKSVAQDPLEIKCEIKNEIEDNFYTKDLCDNNAVHASEIFEENENYKCELCPKIFSSKGNIEKHIKNIHEGQKNNKCDFCDKAFKDLYDLKRHIRCVHERQKNYKCDICGKCFGRPYR